MDIKWKKAYGMTVIGYKNAYCPTCNELVALMRNDATQELHIFCLRCHSISETTYVPQLAD